LIERIVSYCDQRDRLASCNDCQSTQHTVCHGNIELLIRAFVEMTLKHNLVESMYMDEIVPSEHRIAHNQAHMDIAQQLKEIRLVFTADGNGIQAIEGIDRVRQTLIGMYHGEKFNAWTHLIGALLALTGAVWLLTIAASSGDAWKIFSVAVYGATLVMLYSISTLYHSVRGRRSACCASSITCRSTC
jgi:hypothetical protein